MVNSLGNIGNINPQLMNSKINVGSFNQDFMNYRDINKLDDLSDESGKSELLKGVVTKIQSGQRLEETDFEGLSHGDSELIKDLQGLVDNTGQSGISPQRIHSTQEVAENFSGLLDKYLNNVNQKSQKAREAVETFASGGDIDIHSVMIASEKASLSMQLAMQLRNKAVQAYTEIKNIRV